MAAFSSPIISISRFGYLTHGVGSSDTIIFPSIRRLFFTVKKGQWQWPPTLGMTINCVKIAGSVDYPASEARIICKLQWKSVTGCHLITNHPKFHFQQASHGCVQTAIKRYNFVSSIVLVLTFCYPGGGFSVPSCILWEATLITYWGGLFVLCLRECDTGVMFTQEGAVHGQTHRVSLSDEVSLMIMSRTVSFSRKTQYWGNYGLFVSTVYRTHFGSSRQ